MPDYNLVLVGGEAYAWVFMSILGGLALAPLLPMRALIGRGIRLVRR